GGFMAFSADGKVLAVSDGYAITLWDRGSGKRLGPSLDGHDQYVGRVTFLPDGKTLCSTSGHALSFWQIATGHRMGLLAGLPDPGVLSPDGKTLATSPAGEKQAIELWDTRTGKKLQELEAEKYSAYALGFSPDGKTLAAARTGQKTLRLWDVVS